MVGSSDGAGAGVGKLSVPGRPTYSDTSIIVRTGSTVLTLGAYMSGACFDIFLPSVISLAFLPLPGVRPDKDWNTVPKGRLTRNKQPSN